MNKLVKITILSTVFNFSAVADTNIQADSANQTHHEVVNSVTTATVPLADKSDVKEASETGKYQKVIDEFKKYMLTVKPEVKSEIKEFRQKIKELNDQKTDLYHKLTEEAQGYLKQEKEFKKKLPVKQRKDFVKDVKESVSNTETSKVNN
jgi:hypothetical protein